MKRLMQSVQANITKAREERTSAETNKPNSREAKDKVRIKEESTSASTCSQSNQSSVSSVNQGKQINRTEGPKVFHLAKLSFFDKVLRENSSLLE